MSLLSICIKNVHNDLNMLLRSVSFAQSISSDIFVLIPAENSMCQSLTGFHVIPIIDSNVSEALNQVLDRAEGEWVLNLDYNEQMSVALANNLDSLLRKSEVEGYYLPVETYVHQCNGLGLIKKQRAVSLRLYRNRQDYRYTGTAGINMGNQKLLADGPVECLEDGIFALHNSVDEFSARKQHNILHIKHDQDVNNPACQLALAEEYLALGDSKNYYQILVKVINLHKRAREYFGAMAAKRLAEYFAGHGEPEKALTVLAENINQYPDYTDLRYLNARVALDVNDTVQARKLFLDCLSLGRAPAKYFPEPGVGSYKALYGLGQIEEIMGNYQQATKLYQESFRQYPEFTEPLYRIAEIVTRAVGVEAILPAMKQIIDLTVEVNVLVVCDILLVVKAFSEAKKLLQNSSVEFNTPEFSYFMGYLELVEKNIEQAEQFFSNLNANGVLYQKSLSLLIFSCWAEDNYESAAEYLQTAKSLGGPADYLQFYELFGAWLQGCTEHVVPLLNDLIVSYLDLLLAWGLTDKVYSLYPRIISELGGELTEPIGLLLKDYGLKKKP